MKITNAILIAVAVGIVFFLIGYVISREASTLTEVNSSISTTRQILKTKEINEILTQLEIKAEMVTVDEGGLFSVKNVTYIKGTIKNNACVAKAKDVVLLIEFYSKTKALITSREVTVYEYINPYSSIAIKEKIDLPEKGATFTCRIKSAFGE